MHRCGLCVCIVFKLTYVMCVLQVRQYAAVLLRKKVIQVWKQLTPDIQST